MENTELYVEGNECVTISSKSIVTEDDGIAHLKMTAAQFSLDCEAGKLVKVCLAQNDKVCTKIIVHTKTTVDSLIPEKSVIALYYEIPREVRITYQSEVNSTDNIKLAFANGQKENLEKCAEIMTDSLKTNENGVALLQIKAKTFSDECYEGIPVTVCLAENDKLCTQFTVRTDNDSKCTESGDKCIDANHNLMIDEYETNTDKDKYPLSEYDPKKCDSYCHTDRDCEDFCDSAIGYQCSTRCTRDDQCIMVQDEKDANKWVQLKCRIRQEKKDETGNHIWIGGDGRCAFPEFKVVYKIGNANQSVTMGGQFTSFEGASIDWGDGKGPQKITQAMSSDNYQTHKYTEAKEYTVTITGDYDNWTAGCSEKIDVIDVKQYGPIGLGYMGDPNHETSDQGAFTNCYGFGVNTSKSKKLITAKDIPDAFKLTNMSSMFGANAGDDVMRFDDPSIAFWDTSNVKEMYHTFINTGDGERKIPGFNQDIGRWNTTKVTSMNGMFLGAINFNQYIGCWNVSKVTNINSMFDYADDFNQNFYNWNFVELASYSNVFTTSSSHVGSIGIKNYCSLRYKIDKSGDNEIIDIGRTQCIKGETYFSMCQKTYDNSGYTYVWEQYVDGFLADKDYIENYYSKHKEYNKPETAEDVRCVELKDWWCEQLKKSGKVNDNCDWI